ncbi:PD-(D/E)XK nuclease family protein [Patescibacteria group bacterium]|nr:PD-(D/E)XK nuclease family protein [Patescibacteria group bacterium]
MLYQRTRNKFDPQSKQPFKLSRSKLELFLECPRCFYLDRRLGVNKPPGFPFTLNSAVDALLKKEFDIHRAKGQPHPLMKHYKIKAVPFTHDDLNKWRENFVGVQHHHLKTNLIIFGAIDDVWINDKDELMVVDYKATSTSSSISLDDEYRQVFKRQMEIYQWLLRRNNHQVSDTGYFVYCNGRRDKQAFDSKLEFDVEIISYQGSDKWVEQTILDAHACLKSDDLPEPDADCDYCNYRRAVKEVIKNFK